MLQPKSFQSLADPNASLIKRNRQQANVPSLADGKGRPRHRPSYNLSQTVIDILSQLILKLVWICSLLYRI